MRSTLIFAFALLASAAAQQAPDTQQSNSTCPCDDDIQDLQSQVSTLGG